jgi:hypothetical protein
MKTQRTFLIILTICFLIPITSMAQIDDISKGQIKQLIKDGALNPLGQEAVRDTVNSDVVVVDDKNNTKKIKSKQNKWTDDNVDLITDSIEDYLVRYNIQIDSNKESIMMEHLQEYAAFKTAIFSTVDPSDELAQIIAGQIARGIRWMNRSDINYPNQTQRDKAKEQIHHVMGEIANFIMELTVNFELDDVIKEEIDILLVGYNWRTDSPFFSTGKKVFNKKELDEIVIQCLQECAKKFEIEKLSPPFSLPPERAPLFKYSQEFYIKSLIHKTVTPLALKYLENTNRAPTTEEQEESKTLLAKIKNDLNKNEKRNQIPTTQGTINVIGRLK